LEHVGQVYVQQILLPLSLIDNLSEFTLAVGGEDMYMGEIVVYPFSGKLAKCLPSQQGGKDNGLHIALYGGIH
jgi:hypothetical protein